MDDEDIRVEVEEVEVQCVEPIIKFPDYIPPCKGKTKVLKEIDKSKVPLQPALLPDEIVFEGPRLG